MTDCGFAPTVRCPHCGHILRPQVTGWARTGLNVRFKSCYGCQKEFKIILYVETSADEIDDSQVRSLQDRVKKERRNRRNFLLDLEKQLVYQRGKYLETVEAKIQEERSKTVELIAGKVMAPGLN